MKTTIGLAIAVILLGGVNIWQEIEMNDLNKEIEKIKMVTNEDKESSEVDIVELREAVVELWERQEAFIEVHDENVEFMNEMKEIQNIIIDYLN